MARYASCILLLLIVAVNGAPRDHNRPKFRGPDVGSRRNVSTRLFTINFGVINCGENIFGEINFGERFTEYPLKPDHFSFRHFFAENI